MVYPRVMGLFSPPPAGRNPGCTGAAPPLRAASICLGSPLLIAWARRSAPIMLAARGCRRGTIALHRHCYRPVLRDPAT